MQLKLKDNPQTAPVFIKKQLKPKPLNYIVQLTEQDQTTRYNKDDIALHKAKLCKKQSAELQMNQPTMSGFQRYFNCFKNICTFFTPKNPKTKQMDVNETQFTELIEKIRSKKNQVNVVLPPQKEQKRVLVLDLDQTLIHTTFVKPEKYDFESEITINGNTTKVYSVKRFGLDAFLFEMSQLYEIVIFTASQKQYADKVVEQIDPKRRISHVLNRDHCIIINKIYYLKNLKILGRDLKNTILVDDNKMAGILQPDNFYKIDQFIGSQKDRKLVQLSSFLKHIHESRYILPIHQSRRRFEEMQIKIKEETVSTKSRNKQESFKKQVQDKKSRYRHRKTNSEVQSLVVSAKGLNNTYGDLEKEKDQTTQPSQTNDGEEEGTAYDLIDKKF